MCKHGDTRLVWVPIPAHLSYTGALRWEQKAVDRCLADLIHEMNLLGIYTANCCCGHGVGAGSIILHNGDCITPEQARQLVEDEYGKRTESLQRRIAAALDGQRGLLEEE